MGQTALSNDQVLVAKNGGTIASDATAFASDEGTITANVGCFASDGTPFASDEGTIATIVGSFASVATPFASVGTPFASVVGPFSSVVGSFTGARGRIFAVWQGFLAKSRNCCAGIRLVSGKTQRAPTRARLPPLQSYIDFALLVRIALTSTLAAVGSQARSNSYVTQPV